jgi:hypothetical protein
VLAVSQNVRSNFSYSFGGGTSLSNLPLKVYGDLGELVEGGLEVLGDFGGYQVGVREVG